MKARDIAAVTRGDLEGHPDTEISRIATIEEAGPGALVFLANPKYEKYLGDVTSGVVLLSRKLNVTVTRPHGATWIRVDDPHLAFARCIATFRPEREAFRSDTPIHPTAVIGERCRFGKDVKIGAYAVLGDDVTVGDDTRIMPGAKIASGTQIGSGCAIYPNVVILQNCKIGNRVILQPGCVVGMDGFGFSRLPDGSYEKFPQVGHIVIEDDVEIGPNDTIARGALGDTRIRKGAKLDGLVHIAHNVDVGENAAFAALVGIAGSSKIGARVVMGGQAGVVGHIEIADDVIVGAQCGVTRTFLQKGIELAGYPGRPASERRREWAALSKLPDLLQEVHRLRLEVDALKKGNTSTT
jgi:UDP-3-O-[3-hydroxymyristoyl] glucosamine N-acyltransferase